MEPNSEQELKQLLDEGRITPEEYAELLAAIGQKKKTEPVTQAAVQEQTPAKNRSGFGKAAMILFIASIVLPILGVVLTILAATIGAPHMRMRAPGFLITAPLILIGMLCAALAFIFGIIGWKTAAGKTAVIGVTIMGALAVLILPLTLFASYRNSAREDRIYLGLSMNESSASYVTPPKTYPLDSLEEVLTKEAQFDPSVSSDGHGSVKFRQGRLERIVYPLFETGPVGVVDNTLIYQAKVKSMLSEGKAYLEMWCEIPGRGEFFSRQLEQPVSGMTDWVTMQTPFLLEAGQSPANVKLNMVIEGIGTVWIDDIQLIGATNWEIEDGIGEMR